MGPSPFVVMGIGWGIDWGRGGLTGVVGSIRHNSLVAPDSPAPLPGFQGVAGGVFFGKPFYGGSSTVVAANVVFD